MNATSIKTLKKAALSATVVALMLGLSACSSMSDQDRNTAVGAGAGAVGGSVLTGGSTAGTVGGAVVGGVIGHEVDDD
ncbi:glycine zipper 2TM domain-containing protein [Vreelandella subglaciescola]|jgi:osmotically inducible lipoprotein OsmB|uniref:Osmotically inducible lipoprotein OsmB n=1 Tax=Vreelandella subglaciescola TaxID=29571 RepID=A0A1M7GRP1_9GAMM|nr:osmotically inducible lipoprotein OsmB [Halomonas subglaciescola]